MINFKAYSQTFDFPINCHHSGMTLQIIERSGEGGQTIISDGFYALERLRSNNPEYFRILCDTDLLIHYIDDARDIKSFGPTITINSSTRQIERIW